MDHQELLSILQNDIDDLILYPNGIEDGVHYDDDVDDDEEDIKKLEEEFNKKLKQSPIIRADFRRAVLCMRVYKFQSCYKHFIR
jgi:hypothetical protein